MTWGVTLIGACLTVMLLAPACLLAVLGLPSLVRWPLGETLVGGATRTAMLVAFCASALALLIYAGGRVDPHVVSYGMWFSSDEGGFAFDFLIDGLSLGFAMLAFGICGIVAAFSHRYMHQEPGYNRYFVLFAMFAAGITLVALAASIEVLFVGWELLGLSSALLVAFFHERRGPVVNGLRIFTVYRVGDAAMLSAAVLLHHVAGSGSLSLLFSGHGGLASVRPEQAAPIAMLIILAVAAKSALLPFSGWLPRAMEGPTPSSAVFYGALSIHAGCFLLLRAEPLLASSIVARLLAASAGVATAFYASLCARAQTDVKSALSFAALTQVGIIIVEISIGWTTLAFVHIVGHACFRLLQFLSAPNILHDLHELENERGHAFGLHATESAPRVRSPQGLYLFALEQGFLDALIDRFLVGPFRTLAGALDRFDRLLCGSTSRGDRR